MCGVWKNIAWELQMYKGNKSKERFFSKQLAIVDHGGDWGLGTLEERCEHSGWKCGVGYFKHKSI